MQPVKHIPLEFLTQAQVRSVRVRAAQEKGTHTEQEWLEVLAECEGKCAKCGSSDSIEMDHAIPVAMEGSTEAIWNIQPLCKKCNASKKDGGFTNYRMERRVLEKLDEGEKQWLQWLIRKATPASKEKFDAFKCFFGDAPQEVEPVIVNNEVMNYLVELGVNEVNRIREGKIAPDGYEAVKLRALADFLQEHRPAGDVTWAKALNLPPSPDEVLGKVVPGWYDMDEQARIDIMLSLKNGFSPI